MEQDHKSGQWSALPYSLLQQEGFVAAFKASNSSISFVGYSFADNIDLIQTGLSIKSSCKDIIPLMQAALDTWSVGLQAIRGALVPTKLFWYAIDFFWWQGSKWSYTKTPVTMDLLMWDCMNAQHSLQLLGPMEPNHTLGVHLALDGNENTNKYISG